jgi:hypothetical protein
MRNNNNNIFDEFDSQPPLSIISLEQIFLNHGRPQTFFQGRAKFSRGGAKTNYLPKKHPKNYIFLEKRKKVKKTYYFARPGGREEGKSPLLPSPADAHVLNDYLRT